MGDMAGRRSERDDMLAHMNPVLQNGWYCFCLSPDEEQAISFFSRALLTFREKEGITLLLSEEDAIASSFAMSPPMAWIVLEVYSALDGVGLTASVASTLADHQIPCNVVAAYGHDHLFVPAQSGEVAVLHLRTLQAFAADRLATLNEVITSSESCGVS